MSVINDCIGSTANYSNATDNEPQGLTSSNIILAIIYSFLSLIIVVSNIGNLFALPHVTVELGAHTVFLFRALAAVDLLTGIFGSGGKLVDIVLDPYAGSSIVFTQIRSLITVICINYSLLILGCVSLNRYLLIAMPFRYKVVTRRKMVITLIVVFVIGVLQAFGSYLYSYSIHWNTGEPFCYFQVRTCDHIYRGFIVIYLFIPVIVTVIITFTNVCLLVIVLDHIRRIKKQVDTLNQKPPKLRNVKGITTLLLVVLTFYLCCAPELVFDTYRMAIAKPDCHPGAFSDFFIVLFLANSCMNSFIYLFTMKSFRKAFVRSLGCSHVLRSGEVSFS